MFYNQVNLPHGFVTRIYNSLRIPYKMKGAIIEGITGNKSVSSMKTEIWKWGRGGRVLKDRGSRQIQLHIQMKCEQVGCIAW